MELSDKLHSGTDLMLEASRSDAGALLLQYDNTIENGYSPERVGVAQSKYGVNQVSYKGKDGFFKKLFDAFFSPFAIVLLVLVILMVVFDVIIPLSKGDTNEVDYWGAIIPVVMIVVGGVVKYIQDTRAEYASEKLKSMISTTTCVVRDGKNIEIPLDQVVLGDIIKLASGDMIPADLRILKCKDLFVGESSLTGESEPIEKTSNTLSFDHRNALELNNLLFMGTNVVSGTATAIVIATGDHTQFGSVARTLVGKRSKTSFDKGISSVSWLFIRFMALMVPVVFVLNGITKGVILGGGTDAWLDALMFGMSVAVGLTPEMLPLIVTSGLAKGALKMSQKKTIVKSINSIQNFGAIDILCTDKTGTLTEDEISLEYYLDINGKEDDKILRQAFLNSYYQTGVKNVMDNAILKHSKDQDMIGMIQNYIKVDEIPFDFSRRRMSVVVKSSSGRTQLITKGAVDEMLAICTHADSGVYSDPVPLTENIRKQILGHVDRLSNEGLRVLCIAQKNDPSVEGELGVKDESDMTLIGYLAFLDPPKESATAALRALKEHGVQVKILTGDSLEVTRCVARMVGLNADNYLVGSQITTMTDAELSKRCETVTIFAKLTPQQKIRIVHLLKEAGHIVGFMGDGINDAGALKEADVGISVDSAVDIAKEFADIILLEKDLMVLEQGIIEGRKTFANIIKYIKMSASSNFGNVFVILVSSVVLPYLPIMAGQILILNLIADLTCIAIPWDNVDPEFLKKPRKWDSNNIGKFMVWIGPPSNITDMSCVLFMMFYMTPVIMGLSPGNWTLWSNNFTNLTPDQQLEFAAISQTGWFILSAFTQVLVMHLLRTQRPPVLKSRASWQLTVSSVVGLVLLVVLPFTTLGHQIGMHDLPIEFFLWLILGVVMHISLITLFKRIFIKRYGELL